jgi:radical SAM protein with 4Fe4S-binding SPASM domain
MILYVLELQQNKYYVGTTKKTANERFQEHRKGANNAAEWTRHYPPIRILESYTTTDLFEENNKVKRLMNTYGIDNVRGGSYSMIQLNNTDYEYLQRELDAANGRCYQCGYASHCANDCTNRAFESSCSIRKRERSMTHDDDNFDDDDDRKRTRTLTTDQNQPCWRCGRTTHWVKDCFAGYDVYGNRLFDETYTDDSYSSTDTDDSCSSTDSSE